MSTSDVERLAESLGLLPVPVVKPALVVISGLPGTGKTYFCSKLIERIPLALLESDGMRKVLFPTPTYSAEESSRLFRAIHQLIEGLLRKGVSLILDATNLSERNREYLYSIADHAGAKLVLVSIEAPPGVVRDRLSRRIEGAGSRSDADWDVYEKMRTSVESIRRRHFVVDTSRDITTALDKIEKEVMR
ncbi:MAG: ATP-binding protein [Chloroflexi bacterium]|nr:ATP-binding protein [Chloroflexota bacterium]